MTYRRKWGVASELPRSTTPAQTGQALGTSGPTADWPFTHLQPGGQCDSTAAQHEHQERGNPPRALRGVARGAGTALPHARGRERWPKQPRPGVMPGIRRRGPRWSEGSGPSRSAHVMSPAATLGYEWQTLPSRKRERAICKLPKRSFRAAKRPKTAPFVDGRERYP